MSETAPAISETLAQVIAADPFARSLGIELLHLQPGHSRMAMVLQPHMDNFNGLAHGGAVFTLADAAFAAASNAHGTVAVALLAHLQAAAPDAGGHGRVMAGAHHVRRREQARDEIGRGRLAGGDQRAVRERDAQVRRLRATPSARSDRATSSRLRHRRAPSCSATSPAARCRLIQCNKSCHKRLSRVSLGWTRSNASGQASR